MPSQKYHLKAYKNFSPFLIPVVVAAIPYWPLPPWIIIGYLAGYFIDPDLDLMGITGAKMRQFKAGFFLWIGWWMIYAAAMRGLGGHRSFWSHFPWVSSAIRLSWFLFPLVVLALRFGYLPRDDTATPTIGVIVGLGFADAVHSFLDARGNK